MNDNDNANMYEIFERLNRVQAMPSKIEEAASAAAEKTRLEQKYLSEGSTGDYSATKARAGKDIGKPGKNFAKIAKGAAERYGSTERGEKVAGAVLNKLRHPKEGAVDEAVRGAVSSMTGERPPTSQAERNQVAQQLKTNRGVNRDNPAVTGYGNRVAPQRGAASANVSGARSVHSTDAQGYSDYQGKDIDPAHKGFGGKLQIPAGAGKGMAEGGTPMTPKQKSFAKLAPPTDKITFADKIAGAKQEVDEMLGDVAADAIKKAISTHKGGKVSSGKGITRHAAAPGVYGGSDDDEGHIVDRMKGPSDTALRGKRKQETDEGFPTVADAEKRLRGKEGKTSKGKVTKTATGLRHTRDYEHDVGADDEKSSSGEKRKAGRPAKYSADAPRQERVTAKSRKTDRTAHGQTGFKKDKVKENEVDIVDQGEYDQEGDMAKNDIKTIVRHAQALQKILGDNDNLPEWVQSKLAKIEGMMISVDEYMQNQSGDDGEEQELDEKAVSKKQQRFMGMVHAAQKGEKPASKEVGKVAKTMKKGDAEDFAKTKHKGLPEKVKAKKEEEVEETTTAGSVATAPAAGKSGGGMSFGKGIYDSVDRKVEAIIAESMSINMSTSTEGGQTITVTASDDDAMKLASLLKMAGIGSTESEGGCDSCGESPCGCDHVDENAPDWPTNKEYNSDALQYAGGLNKPKETGQTTAPVFNRDARRQHTLEDDELARIMEIAGIKEAKKDVDEEKTDEGNKFTAGLADDDIKVGEKIPGTNAIKKKDIDESIFALTNQWRAYKG